MTHSPAHDLETFFTADDDGAPPRLGSLAAGISGSQILRIAAEINALKASGAEVCNLSVGDYAPDQFPVPDALLEELQQALAEGATNYPPATGILELKEAVCEAYERFFGLRYPTTGTVITSGARPVVYSLFRAVLERGDVVLNPTPSWNTHYYTALAEAENLVIPSLPKDGFLPRREALEPHIRRARVLCLCSPGNPTGTLFDEPSLRAINALVLEENARRAASEERPLFVLYDHVYWPITHGGRAHLTPVGLDPEMARYTVFVDGISKAFAATGVRVGWAVGPPDIITGMSRFTSHAGAWAPKPAQLATARFLRRLEECDAALVHLQSALEARLKTLVDGLETLTARRLPLRFIAPEGALYLTLHLDVLGRQTSRGEALECNEDIRSYVLEAAGMGIVPFEAFGCPEPQARGWFRLSVGAVSDADIQALIPRLGAALEGLSSL
jgi:aspartate aminotransferase